MHVRIDIHFDQNTDAELNISSYPSGNNVSNNEQVKSGNSMGYKGFQLSPSDKTRTISTLNGDYRMFGATGYPGISTQTISDTSCVFAVPPVLVLRFYTYDISKIYIAFDRVLKEYATDITLIIDGEGSWTLTNDSAMMSVDLSDYIAINTQQTYVVRVQLNKWSVPNASAKITYIGLDFNDAFTDNALKEFTCSENALNSQMYVQPGIIAQFANISIYDRYGSLHFAAKEMLIQQGADIEISAISDEDDSVTLLGAYVATNCDIRGEDRVVKIDCTDPSINFDKIYVDNLRVKDRSLHDMLTELFVYIKYPWKYQDAATQTYCECIITPNSWFSADTFEKQLQKVCNLGLLRIYWSNGTFVVMRCI